MAAPTKPRKSKKSLELARLNRKYLKPGFKLAELPKDLSVDFRLWVQYQFGFVQVICARCCQEVTVVQTNLETGKPMDDTPLIDRLRGHRCQKT